MMQRENRENIPMRDASSAAPAGTAWLARIHVTLKPVVLDPQGEAVLHGLQQLGYSDVVGVRVGKYLELTLTAADRAAAEEAVRQMCDKLLANPVIERYDFTVAEKSSTGA
jgi:phosphoribosylformylglycinamidine synthase PurS subunit